MTWAWGWWEGGGWGRAVKATRNGHSSLSGKLPARGGDLSLTLGPGHKWARGGGGSHLGLLGKLFLFLQEAPRLYICTFVREKQKERDRVCAKGGY